MSSRILALGALCVVLVSGCGSTAGSKADATQTDVQPRDGAASDGIWRYSPDSRGDVPPGDLRRACDAGECPGSCGECSPGSECVLRWSDEWECLDVTEACLTFCKYAYAECGEIPLRWESDNPACDCGTCLADQVCNSKQRCCPLTCDGLRGVWGCARHGALPYASHGEAARWMPPDHGWCGCAAPAMLPSEATTPHPFSPRSTVSTPGMLGTTCVVPWQWETYSALLIAPIPGEGSGEGKGDAPHLFAGQRRRYRSGWRALCLRGAMCLPCPTAVTWSRVVRDFGGRPGRGVAVPGRAGEAA